MEFNRCTEVQNRAKEQAINSNICSIIINAWWCTCSWPILVVSMVSGLGNYKSCKVRVSCPISIFMLHLQKKIWYWNKTFFVSLLPIKYIFIISKVKVAKLIAPPNFLHATPCMSLPSKLPPKYEGQDRRRTTMTAQRVVVLATTLPKRNLFVRRSSRASTHRFFMMKLSIARPSCLIYWRILSQRSAAGFFVWFKIKKIEIIKANKEMGIENAEIGIEHVEMGIENPEIGIKHVEMGTENRNVHRKCRNRHKKHNNVYRKRWMGTEKSLSAQYEKFIQKGTVNIKF